MSDQVLCKLIKLVNRLDEARPGEMDVYVDSGSIVGSTLVLTRSDNSTVNIPLTGLERIIDFSSLTGIQRSALSEALRGELVCDAGGTPVGYLLPL